MKRTVCCVLTILFIKTIVFNQVPLVFKTSAFSGLDSFSAQVLTLIDNNNTQSIIEKGSASTKKGKKSNNSCSARIIVKSHKEPEKYDAIGVASGYRDLWVFQFPSVESATYALNMYQQDNSIEYAEQDCLIKQQAIKKVNENTICPWGSEMTGFDEVKDYSLYSNNTLYDVNVAIIDSSVETSHSFLRDRVNPRVTSLAPEYTDEFELADEETLSHATHIAGIIVANTLSNVKLYSYDVFGKYAETSTLLISLAIDCAIRDQIQVINLSLGGDGSETLKASLQNAYDNNVVLVAAAGNDGVDCSINEWPACFPGAITVSAVDKNCRVASWSNYGDSVDIAAPGDEIYSCLCGNSYGYMSGTSMATPFVTAAAAWVIAYLPAYSPDAIEKTLKAYSTPYLQELRYYGDGILQIAESLPCERAPLVNLNPISDLNYNCLTVSFVDGNSCDIYYSLNGQKPTKDNGLLYNGPFDITESCCLKWCCYLNSSDMFRSVTQEQNIHIYTIADENDFIINEEGVITSYHGEKNCVIVPDSINGVTITAIGEYAFYNDEVESKIKDIILPDSATEILPYAFFECTDLEYIAAPNVVSVGKCAFQKDNSLKIVDFPSLLSVDKQAFSYCITLSSFNVPNIESIEERALEHTYSLKTLLLEKLSLVGKFAFQFSGITFASFPYLQSLGESYCTNCFKGCDLLEEIHLASLTTMGIRNSYGALNMLPKLRVFDAPKLTSLLRTALSDCNNLEEIHLESVKRLKGFALSRCPKLKSVWLPNVITVEENVFYQSGVEFLYLGKVATCNAVLTHNCSIVVPSNVDLSALDDASLNQSKILPHIKVFCVGGIAAEWGTQQHSFCTSEWIQTPSITKKPYLQKSSDNRLIVKADYIALNPSLQWYGSFDGTIELSEKIIGQTEEKLYPSPEDKYLGYFFEVSDYDEDLDNIAFSPVLLKKDIFADYSTIDDILATVPKDLSVYTDESVAELNEVIASIDRRLDVSEQAMVDGYVEALSGALSNLKLKQHTVSFITDGKTIIEYDLEYGNKISNIPDDPVKLGYSFIGWSPNIPSSMPNNSMTFTAVFEPLTYYATFTADGEEIECVPFTVEDERINAPDVPPRDGYVGKWSEYIIAASDIIINAEYITDEYTVIFVADDKTIKSESVEFGSPIEVPDNPQKNGYIFKEWLPKVPETMPAKDMSFYAVFEEIQKPVLIPSVSINNYVSVRTVDYKTTIIFTAVTDNMPEGTSVVWYKDGEEVATGEKLTVKEATEAFILQAKIVDESGSALSSSETELVKVKTGLFSKLIAFFRMLFGKLPIVEQ